VGRPFRQEKVIFRYILSEIIVVSTNKEQFIMANIYGNSSFRGFTGAFSDQFIAHETHAGKKILTRKPLFDENRDYVEYLQAGQAAILESTTYANFARTQDVYLEKELETGLTAYNLAIADWFVAPKVSEINVDRWTGEIGQSIRVKARDNVRVARVMLVIRDGQGNVLEAGDAAQLKAGSPWWNYTTRSLVLMTPFPSVQAIAFDLAGNRDSFTIS
jgi:hypothetical protein